MRKVAGADAWGAAAAVILNLAGADEAGEVVDGVAGPAARGRERDEFVALSANRGFDPGGCPLNCASSRVVAESFAQLERL